MRKLKSSKAVRRLADHCGAKKMNKLIKEILTNKKTRNFSALMVFVVSVMSAGSPWGGE